MIVRLTLAAVILHGSPAHGQGFQSAQAGECEEAVEEFNDAIGEIDGALRRYVNCVNSSDGDDDCSTEFRRLKRAQDSFESAVSEIDSECD